MSSEYLVYLDPEVKGRLFSLLKSCAKCKIIVTPDSSFSFFVSLPYSFLPECSFDQ